MHAKQRKIVVLGYRGVGKTSLVTRYVTGQFPDIYSPTIENNYSTTVVTRKQNEYHLQVVDTAGQDELSHIPSMYAINVDGYILVYSVQSTESFNVVQSIYERLVSTAGLTVGRFPVVLVANKIDLKPAPRPPVDLPSWLVGTQCEADISRPPSLPDVASDNESIPRAVSCELGRSLAARWQATYVETSALDSINVSKVFEHIGERLKAVDDGQYLMSTTGLNQRSSWTRRRRSRSKSGNRKRVDAWWRKLMCTSSTAVSESQM